MSALDDWIAQTLAGKYSDLPQNLIAEASTVAAALALIEAGLQPGGPFLPLAGGTMIGTITGADGSAWSAAGLAMAAGKIITPAQVAGIVGTNTNNNAAAGSFGEFIESVVTNAAPLAITASSTAQNFTSLPLTAGDWDVEAQMQTVPAVSTTTSSIILGLNTSTGALPNPERFAELQIPVPASDRATVNVSRQRFSLAAPATIFAVADVSFAVSTMSVCGYLNARRAR